MSKSKFLPKEEFDLRIAHLQELIKKYGFDAIVINTNANIYYTVGCVLSGYVYVPAQGNAIFFVHRPVGLKDDRVVYIHKPEQIAGIMQEKGIELPKKIAFELDRIPYSQAKRLSAAFSVDEMLNCSPLMAESRSVKTDYEIAKIAASGVRHSSSYKRIKGLFQEGMTDSELQIEIERKLRLDGCLGIFRVGGESMEIFMGNVLSGMNADYPSPYDFALGGEGLDSSLPVGCNGAMILPGQTVMVDMNGDFNGYMTDMTRTFYLKSVEKKALEAHQLSIDIHRALEGFIKPGVAVKDAYNLAFDMAKSAGFEDYFMGHNQHAGFIGHGLGIEINELPVLAPRSKGVFEKGNVIAIEPKFVIPGTGAVGIENTYVVTSDGIKCLTVFPEELSEL